MKAVPFFTDDFTVVPHSVSSELADKLESPITIAEFTRRSGNHPVAVYETDAGEIYVVSRPRHRISGSMAFMEGKAV
jgi:hypothetical protein